MIATALPAYGLLEPDMPKETTLLAFDPGGTTGWFMASWRDEGLMDPAQARFGQLERPQHHVALWSLLENTLRDHRHLMVVTEDYKPEFSRAQNYVALEYIGVMEAFCRGRLVPFERQDRGIKTFWTSENLRKVGFWPKGMPHAQDAARHWLAYAGKQNANLWVSFLQMLK